MPKLTKTLIDNIKAPDKGDLMVWDTELPGFGVRVQTSGRKSYVVFYRTKDSRKAQRKMVICRCSDAPPDKARAMARDIFQSVAAGNDPAADRRPTDAPAVTIEDLFKARVAYMHARGYAMADNVDRMLLRSANNAADSIGRKKYPGDVTADDIVKYVSTFYQAGHRGAADKARSYLAATFSWAIKSANDYTVAERQDWGVKHNPAADIAKDEGAIGVRDRNLSADELRVFWAACNDGNAGFTEGTEVCLQMIIACGQRVQETLRMDGADIDLEQKLWKMPAPKTKGKKYAHIIPLPDIIIPRLQALKDEHGDGPLFPATRSSSQRETLSHLAVAHAVRRFCTDADTDMPAFQPRDLRRTWKSRAHDAGVDRFTRDLIQQHAKSDTGSKNYDRADYLPQMRDAMDKWNAWLTAAIQDPEPQQMAA
ncbi:site-specific integrase [Tardiphaga sp. 862_B3_N1_1]|uniref:site-specific integrase n=1 Tax=Tardiphaga sp. 862_B3_N1_1 TaxID=3240763 RepID=UPI003F8A1809